MKGFDLEKIVNGAFWSLAIFAALAVIGVSAGINFKYGAQISYWFAGVFAVFGISEVLLPAMRIRCQSRFHRRLASGTAVLLVFISFITSVSFLQSSRQNVEDQQKGTVSTMISKQQDAVLAQETLSTELYDLKSANEACAKQREINAKNSSKGYVTRDCGAAQNQKEVVEKARNELKAFRRSADGATSNIIPENERIYHDLSSIFGGSAKAWETAIGLLLCVMIAGLGWVFLETLSHIREVEKEKKNRKQIMQAEIEEKKRLLAKKQLDEEIQALEKRVMELPEEGRQVKKKAESKPVDNNRGKVVEFKAKPKRPPSSLDIARKLIQEGRVQPTNRGLTRDGKRFGLNIGNDAVPGIRNKLVSEGVLVKVGGRYKVSNKHLSQKGE